VTQSTEHPRARTAGLAARLMLLGLWTVFFFIGLFPMIMFQAICRLSFGWVPSGATFPYSDFGITVALAAYFGLFAHARARDAGLGKVDALWRGIYAGTFGLVAFLGGLPFLLTQTGDWLLAAGMLAKVLLWVYLYTLVLRYCLFNQAQVFATFLPRVLEPETASEGRAESGEPR
jgi:hypothetical protein